MTEQLQQRLQSTLGSAYTLERELRGGGMSRVFLAQEPALGRHVVIKVLPPELKGAVLIARFRREIALAARLQHAHIVPVHAAGECDGLPFFTMPFVKGDSLRVRLGREARLPMGDVVRMLREIASALAFAHEHGVVHRDIKPDNILLSGDAALVTDFGVAKALETSSIASWRAPLADEAHGAEITSIGVALGTAAYMAPEQADGDAAVDHRADIYSLGAMAYEMLTGRPPFTGKSRHAVLAAQISQIPDAITALRADIPMPLATLVMRCLEKLPADRPQTANEVVRDLDAIAGISAERHVSGRARAVAPRRRWRPAAALAGLTVVAAALVMQNLVRERPRLAVLPFENLGPPADEYFADGLTEELSSRLVSVSGLGIIGRSSAQEYKGSTKSVREIGDDLHVSYVLTGTVRWERRADGTSRVRVSPQLVRVADGTSAWSASYDGPLSDVFKFQTSVAEAVAEALSVAVPPRERLALFAKRTLNLQAYDAYLRGLASSTRENLFNAGARNAAIQEFQRAATLDPAFAAAHARLSLAYVNQARIGRVPEALDAAQLHLQKAIALDSAGSETRLAVGWYSLERDDLEKAYAAVQGLLGAEPTNSRGLYLHGLVSEQMHRPDDAIASYRSAEALEPKGSDAPAALAALYDALGRHADAIRSRDREIALTPTNGAAYFAQAASLLLWRYDTAAARRELERGIAAAGLAAMLRLPSNWMLDWGSVLPERVAVALDTLSRPAAAMDFPGVEFDDMKMRLYTLGNRPNEARIFADSLIRTLEPRRYLGGFETGLLLAPAYVALGRLQDAQRESDTTYAMLRNVAAPRRHIPGMIALAWVDMSIGRPELALQRLESVTAMRSGFYISAAILRQDARWSRLRSVPGFARLVASVQSSTR